MSDSQLQQLEALLTTVQTNKQKPRPARAVAAPQAKAASASPGLPAESPSSALKRPPAGPADRRAPAVEQTPDRRVAAAERRPVAIEMPFNNARDEHAAPPPPPNANTAKRDQAAAARSGDANAEIVPRVIEPDAPRASTRPIAQLVSKHVPQVDATFGAMLKRSLSLRPH
ncbi:MAG: hypothetical protein RLZZ450_6141 [Pseudomonadota bacterium]|jgi:hypothetical protein